MRVNKYRLYERVIRITTVSLQIVLAPYILILWGLTRAMKYCILYLTKYRDGIFTVPMYSLLQLVTKVTAAFIGKDALKKIVDERSIEMGQVFAIKPGEVQEYILKNQKDDPVEEQITWLVSNLTVREMADIQDHLFSSTGVGKKRQEQFLLGKQTHLTLRKGLKGWRNFNSKDGTPCEWEDPTTGRNIDEHNRIIDRNLDKIPPNVRNELSEQMRGEAELGED